MCVIIVVCSAITLDYLCAYEIADSRNFVPEAAQSSAARKMKIIITSLFWNRFYFVLFIGSIVQIGFSWNYKQLVNYKKNIKKKLIKNRVRIE